MNKNLVSNWFGSRFSELHPLLQTLHTSGGVLRGDVDVKVGRGVAGFVGRRLARKLGIPTSGVQHELLVTISHHVDGLHWDRCFDGKSKMQSVFQPLGHISSGYWIEHTGPIRIYLTVDTTDGGWTWRCLGFKYYKIPLPSWLFPKTIAYKKIEEGKYRFHVSLALPLMGEILSYRGLLSAEA